jgi:hypothetical protein
LIGSSGQPSNASRLLKELMMLSRDLLQTLEGSPEGTVGRFLFTAKNITVPNLVGSPALELNTLSS